jgi:hypothetical protein
VGLIVATHTKDPPNRKALSSTVDWRGHWCWWRKQPLIHRFTLLLVLPHVASDLAHMLLDVLDEKAIDDEVQIDSIRSVQILNGPVAFQNELCDSRVGNPKET